MAEDILPVCNVENDGRVFVFNGEALVCQDGDWRRLNDGALFTWLDIDQVATHVEGDGRDAGGAAVAEG